MNPLAKLGRFDQNWSSTIKLWGCYIISFIFFAMMLFALNQRSGIKEVTQEDKEKRSSLMVRIVIFLIVSIIFLLLGLYYSWENNLVQNNETLATLKGIQGVANMF